MKYTYLLIDLSTILIPFIFSFYPKPGFYHTWKALLPSIIITGIFFVLCDSYFTSIGVWGFNHHYLTSVMTGNLPIEEVLFFVCIPYSCLFTFHCLDAVIKVNLSKVAINVLRLVSILITISIAIYFHDKKYTFFTFSLLSALLIIANYVLKVTWLPKFYLIYAILLIPFLIVNGLLTGTGLNAPVVWYNNNELIGLRILTIPIEDVFYGMALILMNLLIYLHLISKRRRISVT